MEKAVFLKGGESDAGSWREMDSRSAGSLAATEEQLHGLRATDHIKQGVGNKRLLPTPNS